MIEITAKKDSGGRVYFEAIEGEEVLIWDYSLPDLFNSLADMVDQFEQYLIDSV